ALPVMFDAAERELGIPRSVAGFVLPLGASVNRAGSALFQAVAVAFVARLYGSSLGLGDVFQAGAAVFLTSLTVAAVPSASIVSLAPAFASTGLPLAGLTLLLGLDRVPDMFRTMTNVAGHLTAATVVAAGATGRRTDAGLEPGGHPAREREPHRHARRRRADMQRHRPVAPALRGEPHDGGQRERDAEHAEEGAAGERREIGELRGAGRRRGDEQHQDG